MTWIEENSLLLLCALGVAIIVLFVLCIILFVKVGREKKRYDFFMGSNRRPSHNLEMKIHEFYDTSKAIDEKYTKLLDTVIDLDNTMKTNIQKVGIIRYNPFDEMGGNLCFALALLDGEDNGVVINGIHSRTGSFTYAKPVKMGVSTYMLSDEEIRAVEMAKDKAYKPEHEKVIKVKFKPTFNRKDREMVMEEQLELSEVKDMAEKRGAALGDVTSEEKIQIEEEGNFAGKVASADVVKAVEVNTTDFVDKTVARDTDLDDDLQLDLDMPVFIDKAEMPDESER